MHLVLLSKEYKSIYHNHELLTLNCGLESIFARCAWSIFPFVGRFLYHREDRLLLLKLSDDGMATWRNSQHSRRCGRMD